MNTRLLFRLLVVMSPIAWIAAAWLDLSMQWGLDADIQAYLDKEYSGAITRWMYAQPDHISLLFAALLVTLLVANTVGLFLFKRWGRTLAAAMFAVSVVLTPAFGYTLWLSGWATTIAFIAAAADSAVLALAYFSEVKNEFERRANAA